MPTARGLTLISGVHTRIVSSLFVVDAGVCVLEVVEGNEGETARVVLIGGQIGVGDGGVVLVSEISRAAGGHPSQFQLLSVQAGA